MVRDEVIVDTVLMLNDANDVLGPVNQNYANEACLNTVYCILFAL